MKTIESRLNDLEGKLKPDTSNVVVVIMDDHFYKNGASVDSYFENKEEKEAFLDWRIKLLREEMKFSGKELYVYDFIEPDVQKYLEIFRQILQNQENGI
ncbi:MAG: hypothetical protein AAB410_00415 [Patescibacteria group bacterium]